MVLGDRELFTSRICSELDYLHSVYQRSRYGIKCVCCSKEYTVREVVWHLYEVIAEVFVLLGIKHLEKSARRVSVCVAGELVNLIKKNERIVDTRL